MPTWNSHRDNIRQFFFIPDFFGWRETWKTHLESRARPATLPNLQFKIVKFLILRSIWTISKRFSFSYSISEYIFYTPLIWTTGNPKNALRKSNETGNPPKSPVQSWEILNFEVFPILNWRFGRVSGLVRLFNCVFRVSRRPNKWCVKKYILKLIMRKKKLQIHVQWLLTEPIIVNIGLLRSEWT